MNKIIRLLRSLIHDFVLFICPKFIRKKMLSCEKASYLLEQVEKLRLIQRFKLKMHLFICQCCVDYKEQISIIISKSKEIKKIKLTKEQQKKISDASNKVLKKYSK